MKLYLIVFLALALFTVHQQLNASGSYDPPPPPPPPEPPVVTTTTTTTPTLNVNPDNAGVASAIASGNCQFDWTYSYQGCAAVGSYDGNGAAAFGLGKRYKEVLFNGTVSIEEGELGVGAAVNWKFK